MGVSMARHPAAEHIIKSRSAALISLIWLKPPARLDVSAGYACSDAERIGLGEAFEFVGLERSDRPGLIKPDVLVELPWQDSLEIVAGEFALRAINDAYCPLEPGVHQLQSMCGLPITKIEHEMWRLAVVTKPFVACFV